MSSNEREEFHAITHEQTHEQTPGNPIGFYLNNHSNVEDWSILYESNKTMPIKIYVKLSIYMYEDYGKMHNNIYKLGFSNIEIFEFKKRY